MSTGLLVLLAVQAAAAPPAATPTATPPINVLVSRSSAGTAVPAGSLAEFAKKTKLKLPEGQPRVLTNENVKQLAEGIELTTTLGGGPPAGAAGPGRDDGKRAMWQQRYRAAVSQVGALEAEVKRLEAEASRLEQEFYAHDDPFERDAKIKPAWDKALADLGAAKAALAEARNAPDEVWNAARRDGALPGWFRGLEASGPGAPAPAQPPANVVAPPRPEPTTKPTPRPPARPAGPG